MHYAHSFPEEIQTAITDNRAIEESDLKGLIPDLIELEVAPEA